MESTGCLQSYLIPIRSQPDPRIAVCTREPSATFFASRPASIYAERELFTFGNSTSIPLQATCGWRLPTSANQTRLRSELSAPHCRSSHYVVGEDVSLSYVGQPSYSRITVHHDVRITLVTGGT